MSESKNYISISTRVPKELHKSVKSYCADEDIKMQEFIQKALEEYLKKMKGKTQ